MPALRSGEVTRLQTVQDYHMHDSCKILTYSSSVDSYNIPQPTYTAGSEIYCGFEMVGTEERVGETEYPDIDAKLRLPIGTVINSNDRVRITKRFGVAVTEIDYSVIGQPLRGSSGLVVELKKVSD